MEYEKINIGKLGEHLACRFLEEKGIKIVERNYRKPWGEIDIIAQSPKKPNKNKETGSVLTKFSSDLDSILHFVEVKAVSCENNNDNISHETDHHFHPKDNIHPRKIKKLSRTIQSYLSSPKFENIEWQFDVIAIWIDLKKKKSKIEFTENIPI